jgi:transposase InsO family protein
LPWKVFSVELQRELFCYRIVHQGLSVAQAAREAQVSRKTIYKFLARYKAAPGASLTDHSRRPHSSPVRVSDALEQAVMTLRDAHRYGSRKIHLLLKQKRRKDLCSIRTITSILHRHDRISSKPVVAVDESLHSSFEHPEPNDLWQVDHKGPLEIARVKHHPWTVIDDHSRYCLCFEPLTEKSLAFVWPVMWECFGEYGMPQAILSDGAFADRGTGISQWDQRLIRLGIRPIHGRPYHPQTQGKVERLHRTIQWELLDFGARTDSLTNFIADRDRWQKNYNCLRPHQAIHDAVPISRYRPSKRTRPKQIPEMTYANDDLLRQVSQVGDISYHRKRIAVGRALARQQVRLVERNKTLEIYFGPVLVRSIELALLANKRHNQIV